MLQPFACVLAVERDSGRISHVSENAQAFVGHDPQSILASNARDLLGGETWHALCNAASHPDYARHPITMTNLPTVHDNRVFRAFASGPYDVIEVEHAMLSEFGSTPMLDVMQMAMSELLPKTDETALAAQLLDLLRHFSGFDRLVLWHPAQGGQAAIITESKRRGAKSARPASAQWKEIWQTGQAAIRLEADTQSAPVAVRQSIDAPAPLDIGLAMAQWPNAPFRNRLMAQDDQAGFQWRLEVDGHPWGVVEGHSAYPRRLSPAFFSLLRALAAFLDARLQGLTFGK